MTALSEMRQTSAAKQNGGMERGRKDAVSVRVLVALVALLGRIECSDITAQEVLTVAPTKCFLRPVF